MYSNKFTLNDWKNENKYGEKTDSQLLKLVDKFNKGIFLTSEQKKKVDEFINNKSNSLDEFPELQSINSKKVNKFAAKDFNLVKNIKNNNFKENEIKKEDQKEDQKENDKIKKIVNKKVLLTKNPLKKEVSLKNENQIENRKYTEVLKLSDKSKLIKHKSNLNSKLQMINNYMQDILSKKILSYNNYNEWVSNNIEFEKLKKIESENRNNFATGNENLNIENEVLELTSGEYEESTETEHYSDNYSDYNSNYDYYIE